MLRAGLCLSTDLFITEHLEKLFSNLNLCLWQHSISKAKFGYLTEIIMKISEGSVYLVYRN